MSDLSGVTIRTDSIAAKVDALDLRPTGLDKLTSRDLSTIYAALSQARKADPPYAAEYARVARLLKDCFAHIYVIDGEGIHPDTFPGDPDSD